MAARKSKPKAKPKKKKGAIPDNVKNKALYSRVKLRLSVNLMYIPVLMPMHGLFGNTKSVAVLMPKSKDGLTKWFKEEWVDIKTGKPCGRKKPRVQSVLILPVGPRLLLLR